MAAVVSGELVSSALVAALFAFTYGTGLLPLRLHVRLATIDPASWWPELSLWWYLLSLTFMRQLPYHATLAWAHPTAYVAPLTIRLW